VRASNGLDGQNRTRNRWRQPPPRPGSATASLISAPITGHLWRGRRTNERAANQPSLAPTLVAFSLSIFGLALALAGIANFEAHNLFHASLFVAAVGAIIGNTGATTVCLACALHAVATRGHIQIFFALAAVLLAGTVALFGVPVDRDSLRFIALAAHR